MLVKDLKYPSRFMPNIKGQEIHFQNYHAEVPDSIGSELIKSGEFIRVVKPFESRESAETFGFRPDSWRVDRKLVFDTAIGYNNGYGKSGMLIGEALGDLCDTYVVADKWVGYNIEHASKKLKDLIAKKLEVIDTFYVKYYPVFEFKPQSKRYIGYTMLEADRIPQSWVNKIHDCCERVIVPCKAQKDAFRLSGVQCDIEVIPLGINPDEFPYIDRPIEEDFLFGIEGTLTYRKGVDLVIEAYLKAFPKEKYPHVGLYIKTNKTIPMYFKTLADTDSRIVTLSDWLSPEELITEFYAKIDAYAFLSRGEGWSMTTLQAMATGLPVIGSDCSGVQDHLNNKVGYLVPTKLVPVPNKFPDGRWDHRGYGPDLSVEGQMWWEADTDIAAEKMLEIYNNRAKAKAKGKTAAKYVRDNFTAKHTAQKLVEYLDKKF